MHINNLIELIPLYPTNK